MKKTSEIVVRALNALVDGYNQTKNELLQYFWDALQNIWLFEGTNNVPENYAETIFTSHLPGNPGSTFMVSDVEQLIRDLFINGNLWSEFTPSEDSKYPGCRYFRIHLIGAGTLGAQRIEDTMKTVPPKAFAEVRTSHAGMCEIVLLKKRVMQVTDQVTLITEKIGERDVMSTLYPGEPLPKGDVDPAKLKELGVVLNEGDLIQLSRAKELGFKTVKYI